jgi:hypothetical protein
MKTHLNLPAQGLRFNRGHPLQRFNANNEFELGAHLPVRRRHPHLPRAVLISGCDLYPSCFPLARLVADSSPHQKTAPFLHRSCTQYRAFQNPLPVTQRLATEPLQHGAISKAWLLNSQQNESGKEKVKER